MLALCFDHLLFTLLVSGGIFCPGLLGWPNTGHLLLDTQDGEQFFSYMCSQPEEEDSVPCRVTLDFTQEQNEQPGAVGGGFVVSRGRSVSLFLWEHVIGLFE